MKTSTIKANIGGACVIIFFFISCTNNRNPNEKIYASSITGNSATKKLNENDFRFLVKAHSTGYSELPLLTKLRYEALLLRLCNLLQLLEVFMQNLIMK